MGDRATIEADVPRRLLPMVGLATPAIAKAGDVAETARITEHEARVCLAVFVVLCFVLCHRRLRAEGAAGGAGAPKHPDFVFPGCAEGTKPEQASRIDRGWQYLQLDDYRNAEREFAAALKQQPSFHPAETAMAYLAMARGNERDAATRFDRALQADAAYVPALIGRGQVMLELDRDADALASFEAALAKDPSLTDLRSRVDVLKFRATQDMLARAKAAADARRWDEAARSIGRRSPHRRTRGSCIAIWPRSSSGRGRSANALEHYRKAVEIDPGDARSLAGIGAILESQGDVLGALAAYERARAIDPGEVPGRRHRRGCAPPPRWPSCRPSIARFRRMRR